MWRFMFNNTEKQEFGYASATEGAMLVHAVA